MLMISAFMLDAFGFKVEITDQQLAMINDMYRQRNEYVSKESATAVHNTTNKQEFSRKQFDNDMVDSPFLKMFRFGASHDGYWNNDLMKLQFEDCVDCLKVLYPDTDFYFLFDQSSGHTKKRVDGLDIGSMNVEHGGKATMMRSSTLIDGCRGKHAKTLEDRGHVVLNVGDVQEMNWSEDGKELANDDDGPCYIQKEDRFSRRHDVELQEWELIPKTLPELRADIKDKGSNLSNRSGRKKVEEEANRLGIPLKKKVNTWEEKEKTVSELKADLGRAGVTLDRQRVYRKPDLLELAAQNNVSTTKTTRKLTHQNGGFLGKPKGMKQVLWERGWLDPDKIDKYKKTASKTDFDDNGKLIPEKAEFILAELMKQQPDFQLEQSDLQHLADEISGPTCTVKVIFTPKYHCEIAGEGVENGWGFTKKIYRRGKKENKKDFRTFTKTVKECLQLVTAERSRRFRRRCRKYMLGYKEAFEKQDQSPKHQEIEDFVKGCFVADQEQVSDNMRAAGVNKKKRRVKKTTQQLTNEDWNKRTRQETLGDSVARQKSMFVKEAESVNASFEVASSEEEEDIELADFQQQRRTHLNAMDFDSAFLEAEVRAFVTQQQEED